MTHIHPFNCPVSSNTRIRHYQTGKSNLYFTEARDRDWQHQLGNMQVWTSLQTHNHASTPQLSLQTRCHPATRAQPTASKHWRRDIHKPKCSSPMTSMWVSINHKIYFTFALSLTFIFHTVLQVQQHVTEVVEYLNMSLFKIFHEKTFNISWHCGQQYSVIFLLTHGVTAVIPKDHKLLVLRKKWINNDTVSWLAQLHSSPKQLYNRLCSYSLQYNRL